MHLPVIRRFSNLSTLVLRVGLGLVLLWFGAHQAMNPPEWVIWVPSWATSFGMSANTIVMLNGALEIISGICIIMGLLVQPLALIMGLHLIPVVLQTGLSPIGVRDLGLILSFFALALRPDEQV